MRVPSVVLAGAIAVLHSPAMAQSTTFDGAWNVTLTCPPANDTEGTKGYTLVFPAEVQEGRLLGVHGQEGEVGSQRLSGLISPDGNAELRLDGIVGNPDYAIGKSPKGKPFTYKVRARFDSSSGTGERTSGRICRFRFQRR